VEDHQEHPEVSADWEPVHVEIDWYDGLMAGLADVHGSVHYFNRLGDDGTDDYYVWPAASEAVDLELENWQRFAAWNERYEAGLVTTDSHPGHGGLDARYDEVEGLLTTYRTVPESPVHLTATWKPLDGAGYPVSRSRYPAKGPLYFVRWTVPETNAQH
jgi:hypothetical protein